MRTKRTKFILGTVIFVLVLTIATVMVGASFAWFDVENKQTVAYLEVSAGKASASTGLSIASGDIEGRPLRPAIADSSVFGIAYPGNYFTGAEGEIFNVDKASALDPSNDLPEGILSKATSVRFVLSICYAAFEGEDSGAARQVKLLLDGVYAKKDLTSGDGGEYEGYETADGNGRNFKNEFNVKMCLISDSSLDSAPVPKDIVQYDATYSEEDPFGHILTLQAMPNVTYFVKFEIYFNKVDEECDSELLYEDLVLHLKLDMGSENESSRQ